MNLSFRRFLFVILLILPYVLIFAIVMNNHPGDVFSISLRVSGLFGFLSLSLGVIMNILKKEITSTLGQRFITVHHFFVIFGLVLITIHPLSLALYSRDLSIFVPDTSSIVLFFANGGRAAIILIYVGFFAALFRSALKGKWIYIHRITYLALVLAIIHANVIGEDFFDPVIRIVFNAIAGIVIITGIKKTIDRHQKKIRFHD